MQEKALQYEGIIRSLRAVNRLEIPAASADLFRGLERDFIRHRDNNNEENLKKYFFYLGKVNSNIEEALFQFEKTHNDAINVDQRQELSDIDELLWIDPSMTKTDEAIERIIVLVATFGIIIA